eukprot:313247-Pelagomonas_calceolata.AAC.10
MYEIARGQHPSGKAGMTQRWPAELWRRKLVLKFGCSMLSFLLCPGSLNWMCAAWEDAILRQWTQRSPRAQSFINTEAFEGTDLPKH